MKDLEKIKLEYAREQGFKDFNDLQVSAELIGRDVNIIAERYAKALLEEAAENIDKVNRFQVPSKANKMYCTGLETAKHIILSLIPKDS